MGMPSTVTQETSTKSGEVPSVALTPVGGEGRAVATWLATNIEKNTARLKTNRFMMNSLNPSGKHTLNQARGVDVGQSLTAFALVNRSYMKGIFSTALSINAWYLYSLIPSDSGCETKKSSTKDLIISILRTMF
jgi:hypothetical protein